MSSGSGAYDLRGFASRFPPALAQICDVAASLAPNLPVFNMRTLAATGRDDVVRSISWSPRAYAFVYCGCALCLATAAFESRDSQVTAGAIGPERRRACPGDVDAGAGARRRRVRAVPVRVPTGCRVRNHSRSCRTTRRASICGSPRSVTPSPRRDLAWLRAVQYYGEHRHATTRS